MTPFIILTATQVIDIEHRPRKHGCSVFPTRPVALDTLGNIHMHA